MNKKQYSKPEISNLNRETLDKLNKKELDSFLKEYIDKKLEEGYIARREEDLEICKEFEAADLDGWDDF